MVYTSAALILATIALNAASVLAVPIGQSDTDLQFFERAVSTQVQQESSVAHPSVSSTIHTASASVTRKASPSITHKASASAAHTHHHHHHKNHTKTAKYGKDHSKQPSPTASHAVATATQRRTREFSRFSRRNLNTAVAHPVNQTHGHNLNHTIHNHHAHHKHPHLLNHTITSNHRNGTGRRAVSSTPFFNATSVEHLANGTHVVAHYNQTGAQRHHNHTGVRKHQKHQHKHHNHTSARLNMTGAQSTASALRVPSKDPKREEARSLIEILRRSLVEELD